MVTAAIADAAAGPDPAGADQLAAVGAAVGALRTAMAGSPTPRTRTGPWPPCAAKVARPRPRGPPTTGDCGATGLPRADSAPATAAAGSTRPSRRQDGDGTNGNLPRSAMTALTWCVDSAGHQQWLRSDAAAALTRLNEAFVAQFGENLADRPVLPVLPGPGAGQAAVRWAGRHARGPRTTGAVFRDRHLGVGGVRRTAATRYTWLVTHGPDYGWYCPAATESA